MVTNPQDHPRFQAVFVGRTPSVTALALRDVVVAFCPMENFPPRPAVPHNCYFSKYTLTGGNTVWCCRHQKFACIFEVHELECYAAGWVALALPVWAGLFTGLSGFHETFAYTGRASAPNRNIPK